MAHSETKQRRRKIGVTSHKETTKKHNQTMPTMAPFSFIEGRNHVALRSGSWIDGSCLTRVDCIREEGCSSSALEPYRGPLTTTKDQFSVFRFVPPASNVPSDPSKEKRKVSFETNIEVFQIPHITDLSHEERIDVWWTANDYVLIRKMLRITVQMLGRGNEFPVEDEDFCARGLDLHTSGGSRRHQKHRQRAVRSVLEAQDFQRVEGFTDSEYIAEIYAQCCQSSYETALRNAASDADEARILD